MRGGGGDTLLFKTFGIKSKKLNLLRKGGGEGVEKENVITVFRSIYL